VSTGPTRPNCRGEGARRPRSRPVAKQRSEREIDSRRLALKAIEEVGAKRQDDLEKLQAKLDEAKTLRALIVRRGGRAASRCARASR
jgi:hypothetical protein